MKQKSNIRIIDIAKMAGVSAGTVDRILHNRGRVSQDKRERIEKILKEINYEPNMVARFLASKRSYQFAAIIPAYTIGEYWDQVCQGMNNALIELKNFNVSLDYIYFDQYNRKSFLDITKNLDEKGYDGIIIATQFDNDVVSLTAQLDNKEVPYVFIDTNIPSQRNLTYFGADSFMSGAIAAKLILSEIKKNSDIIIAYFRYENNELSNQMKKREAGFNDYLQKASFSGKIHYIEFEFGQTERNRVLLEKTLDNFENLTGGIVFNSRIYEFAKLILSCKKSLHDKLKLVGYDAIDKNMEMLKNGTISYIVSQRPEIQGYDSIKALSNYFLFSKSPAKVNYMPIDILIKENMEYYNNYKL